MSLTQVNLSKLVYCQKRNLFHWINIIFNRVDEDRRKQFGPDRACAEWLLRNGASVKWANEKEYVKDYNLLPDEKQKNKPRIEEIDATGSSIMHYGFAHFLGCEQIRKIILHKCTHLEDAALKELIYLRKTLQHLQVSGCHNISTNGLLHLQNLVNLKTLVLFELPGVKDKTDITKALKDSLPKCNIDFR